MPTARELPRFYIMALMVSTKAIFDLIAKMSLNNKDRLMGNDLLELTRQMKGLDKTMQDLFQGKIAAGLEIDRLKQEILRLKQGGGPPRPAGPPRPPPAPPPPPPAPPTPGPPPRLSCEGGGGEGGGEPKK